MTQTLPATTALKNLTKELRAVGEETETETADIIDAALAEMAGLTQWATWSGQPRPAPTVRTRINVSDSVKGIRSTDTTLEWFGDLRDYDVDVVIGLRHILTVGVDEKYPPPPLT